MLQKIWSSLANNAFCKAWLGFILLAFISCGTDSHHFSIDGHFLHMNQGDFYVYSPDGAIIGVDTIHVMGGRFAYEIPCEQEGTVVIVLPNFSEIPVFVEPGKSIDMDADASHIKDVDVKGSDANDKMTEWRKNTSSLSPDELRKHAEQFIRENPASVISRWMLRKYFIVTPKPDLRKAKELIALMQKSNADNPSLNRLAAGLENMRVQVGDKIPSFNVKDIQGKSVTSNLYKTSKTIVFCWASWNFEGVNIIRSIQSKIRSLKSQNKPYPKLLGISVDASIYEARRCLGSDSLGFTTVCDGKMWDSPIVKAFGFSELPDNIVIENGKVKSNHLSTDDLMKELEK